MSEGEFLTVPGLCKWQHYKKRTPPWIKLHREVLNDYKFSRLQDASKAHLLAIWLLASQMDNKIPYDSDWIAKRINATQSLDMVELLSSGMIAIVVDASKVIAPHKQSAVVETETETGKTCHPKETNNINLCDTYTDEKGIVTDRHTGEILSLPVGGVQ